VIVGLGKSGVSCARYFAASGKACLVMDDHPGEDRLSELKAINQAKFVGALDREVLAKADLLVMSPGVPLSHPEVRSAIEAGVDVTGDVALFAKAARAPVIAITGSNGKSTVTSLVGHLVGGCGMKAGVGGNIGTPCLDLLQTVPDVYVLEVSSFQLDTTRELPVEIAVVLNLSPDHMDRYADVSDYYASKALIYGCCRQAVINRDIDYDFSISAASVVSFGADVPETEKDFGLVDDGRLWLVKGSSKLVAADNLTIRGRHNALNALAALALGECFGLEMSMMLEALTDFSGLPHRCEWVGRLGDMDFFNDSKATNPASTIAAIEGLGNGQQNLLLILGGQSKSADFSQLDAAINSHVGQVLVFGQDAGVIEKQLSACVIHCGDMADLVNKACELGKPGMSVLFSPACASFDMFNGYAERGDRFRREVQGRLQ